MKNRFKYSELIKTSTGLNNEPVGASKDNIDKLLTFLNLIDWDSSITVNSGFRSKEVNKAVGGVDSSHHCLGLAADLTCKDVGRLVDYLKGNKEIDLLIWYKQRNFVHVSVHPNKRNLFLVK